MLEFEQNKRQTFNCQVSAVADCSFEAGHIFQGRTIQKGIIFVNPN